MLTGKLKVPKLPWGLLAVDAVLIVLSVPLALAVDSWREAREHEALANRALQAFVDEVRENCATIQAVRSYHRAVLDGEREPNGVRVGLLRNDAWDVVKTTGAAAWMDYTEVAALSEISAYQADHRAIFQAYVQALFGNILAIEGDPDWHREGERGVISEMARIQDRLLKAYLELAQLLEHQYGGNYLTSGGICPAAPSSGGSVGEG